MIWKNVGIKPWKCGTTFFKRQIFFIGVYIVFFSFPFFSFLFSCYSLFFFSICRRVIINWTEMLRLQRLWNTSQRSVFYEFSLLQVLCALFPSFGLFNNTTNYWEKSCAHFDNINFNEIILLYGYFWDPYSSCWCSSSFKLYILFGKFAYYLLFEFQY